MTKNLQNLKKPYCDWLRYKKIASISSIKTAEKTMNLIIKEIGNINVKKINKNSIDDLRSSILRRGCSPSYLRKILITIRSFLNFCEDKKIKTTIKNTDIDLPKIVYRLEYFTKTEVQKIINSINTNNIYGLRLRAMTMMMLDSGLRISELLSLNRGDVDLIEKQCWIIGKGNKKGLVFFHQWSLEALKQYLEARKDTHKALFISHVQEPRRLTNNVVEKNFIFLSKKTELKIYAHKLRKTAATLFAHNGGNLHHVQKYLRHSNIKTTEGYIGINYEIIRQAHNKYVDYGWG